MIDAGSGARDLGRTLLERGEFDVNFWMTHFHWDHIHGLPFFAPLLSNQARMAFHAAKPPEKVRTILEAQMRPPYFPGFESLSATREYFEIGSSVSQQGSMQVHAFPLNHPQDACGFRIEAGGAVIVHASDVEHGDRMRRTPRC